MPTQYPDLFAALAAPFEQHEIKIRPAPGGRQLHYITARTAMNKLDAILGPENWWDEYYAHENSVVCRLSVMLPDGRVVTKCDAGGYAGMADQGDDDKSGYSDAFKRAAAKFGIARYLYRDGVPQYITEAQPGRDAVPYPSPAKAQPPSPSPEPADTRGPSKPPTNLPRTGKQLYAWCAATEKDYQIKLIAHVNAWAKSRKPQPYPAKMVEWTDDQVKAAVPVAVEFIEARIDERQDDGDPESQTQEPPSDQPSQPQRLGPLNIDPSDPMSHLKERVVRLGKKLNEHSGLPLTQKAVMERLDLISAEVNGGMLIENLRECTEFKIVNSVANQAERDLKEVEEFGGAA